MLLVYVQLCIGQNQSLKYQKQGKILSFTENDTEAAKRWAAEIRKKTNLWLEDRVYSDALFVKAVCWMKTEPL